MSEQIHETAAKGFDAAAEVYERARPGYPVASVDFVVDALRLERDDTVLDVAAGTGKFTKELVGRGFDCIAVEPVAGMREMFARVLPGVTVIDGTAEALPLDDASIDGITVAQAFHWFRHEQALEEFHRVLRPGRAIALIWNARDDRVDWVARLTEIIDPHAEGSAVGIPRHRDQSWRPALENFSVFEQVAYAEFQHGHPTTPDTLVERVESTSFIAALPPDRKASVVDQVRAVPDAFGLGDAFDFPYVCQVHVLMRR